MELYPGASWDILIRSFLYNWGRNFLSYINAQRFYVLKSFVNCSGQRGLPFFPLREHVVFTFLQSMLHDESAATSAERSFLEACRFARGVLGLRGDLAEVGTTPVDGVAVELAKRAPPFVQASPLLVTQVIALERFVATTHDMKDRALFWCRACTTAWMWQIFRWAEGCQHHLGC